MIGRLRFLFVTIGLLISLMTSANAERSSAIALNLWILPYCDPVRVWRDATTKPTGFSYLKYRQDIPVGYKCVVYQCVWQGVCVTDIGAGWGGPVASPLKASVRGCMESTCIRYRQQ